MLNKKNINVLLIAHKGCGKSTWAAAIESAALSRGGLLGAKDATIKIKRSNRYLQTIANGVCMGEDNTYGTKRPVVYEYRLLYKLPQNINARELCIMNVHDFNGGLFDAMQEHDFSGSQENMAQLCGEGYNGIVLLFSLKQFFGCKNYPIQCGAKQGKACKNFEPYKPKIIQCYSHEDCKYTNRFAVWQMLNSVKMLTKKLNIPIVIAVNHCDDEYGNKADRQRMITEARQVLSAYIEDIFADVQDAYIPRVYFIDSVTAIKGGKPWISTVALPLLDLMIPYLSASLIERDEQSRNPIKRLWALACGLFCGTSAELRESCLNMITDAVNSYKESV